MKVSQPVQTFVGVIVGWLLLYFLLSVFGVNISRVEYPPKPAPVRTVENMNNLSLLWVKEMEIENPHKVWVELFTPNDQSVVFWSPQSDSLIALDLITGETLWETEVPAHTVMRLYNGKFFIVAYQRLNRLADAPVNNNRELPNCSFGGEAAVLTYDPDTGEQIWGYVYQGVDPNQVFFKGDYLYLTGSNDHGASRSVAEIDALSGNIIELECYRWWTSKKEILDYPRNEGIIFSPYEVVLERYAEQQLESQNFSLLFWAKGNRLEILDGSTKEVIGSVSFDGAELYDWDIDVAVQNDVAVIYLDDSNQLFGFLLRR